MVLFSYIFNSDIVKGLLLYFLWGSGNWAQGFRYAQHILIELCIPSQQWHCHSQRGFPVCHKLKYITEIHFEDVVDELVEVGCSCLVFSTVDADWTRMGFVLLFLMHLSCAFPFLVSQFWLNRHLWFGQRIYVSATLLGLHAISR